MLLRMDYKKTIVTFANFRCALAPEFEISAEREDRVSTEVLRGRIFDAPFQRPGTRIALSKLYTSWPDKIAQLFRGR